MALKRSTLEALAVPLNRRDYDAFVAAAERLPSSERNVLAVLGAGLLLTAATDSRGLLRNVPAFAAWLADFQQTNVTDD